MTLILARASSEFILQVTDLLTTSKSSQLPFEKVANKNILFFASNGVVTLAYTGDAHIDNIPTDYWIAERLSGIKFNPYDPPAIQGSEHKKQDIGRVLRNICDELNHHKNSKRLILLISIQGWQWNSKGRARPLVGYITKLPPDNIFGVHYEPRDWYFKGAQTISSPRANFTMGELTELSHRLSNKSALDAERLLVEKIQEVSRQNSWVGSNCISILILQPSNPNIYVRYHSLEPATLTETQKLSDEQQLWAYSPWIISPKMSMLPAKVTGNGITISTGIFTIHFLSETLPHPKLLFLVSGQKRRHIG